MMVSKVFSVPEERLGSQTRTKMAALNGGLTEIVARCAVMEIAPALWPQLYGVNDVNDLR